MRDFVEEMFGLEPLDLKKFSEALLLDERRETLKEMTPDQLMVVRHAFRYGQFNGRAAMKKRMSAEALRDALNQGKLSEQPEGK